MALHAGLDRGGAFLAPGGAALRFATALLALAVLPGQASGLSGDMCSPLPLEGWALVGRWHVGSPARSIREGWLRPALRANDWGRLNAGGWVPAAPRGCWLRSRFTYRKSSWKDVAIEVRGVPAGTRAWLNGAEIQLVVSAGESATLAGEALRAEMPGVRQGDNVLVLVIPAVEAKTLKAPSAMLVGTRPGSGTRRTASIAPQWRVRADQVMEEVPSAWLKSADTSPWKLSLPRPLAVNDEWLVRTPMVLKAVMDLPPPWRGRRFSLFLHGLAGSPEVWLNGEKLSGPVQCPARIDLGSKLKFNGRDTLCLVYPEPPSGPGEDGTWGVAAVHWASGVRPVRLASGSTVLFDGGEWGTQEGLARALRYASEMAEVSATPFALYWGAAGLTPAMTDTLTGAPAGVVVAAWGATAYRASDVAAVRAAVRARVAGFRQQGMRVWVLSPPTVGEKGMTSCNERIRFYNRALRELVKDEGVRMISVFDVFNSALRRMTTGSRSRRWPVKVELTDCQGRLGPQGAYLVALTILNELTAP